MNAHAVVLASETDFAGWRAHARTLLATAVPPEQVAWSTATGAPDLFGIAGGEPEAGTVPGGQAATPSAHPSPPVPRRFLALAEDAIVHSDPARFAILYHLLWRLAHGEPRLLAVAADPLLRRIEAMAAAVRRDIHKMHAFVRFRTVADNDGEMSVAWFEPVHHIVEKAAPFFVRRFIGMRWSILTPRRCAHWDGQTLRFAAGRAGGKPAGDDAIDDLWRCYYASIFNPARLKPKAMRSHMPQRYWHNLPEATLIPSLCRNAPARAAAMVRAAAIAGPATAAAPGPKEGPTMLFEPGVENIDALRRDAAGCRACPLYATATRTVFGEGPVPAPLMLVGEQPGDQEDLTGRPFVGPAGLLLDEALREAGLDREAIYVTNAVKHFKFVMRGKRRLHQKPNTIEIDACRSWLQREIAVVRPQVVVALGATAARALTGRELRIGANRGRRLTLDGGTGLQVTVHPSYLLRLPDEDARTREYQAFVADLAQVAALAPLAAART